jgi:hypothetical protein
MRTKAARAVRVGTCGALAFALGACTFAPYAPKDQTSLAPQGESEPVVVDSANPLESPVRIEVICSPQGHPLVMTPEIEECEADESCRVVCENASPRP